LSRNTTNLFREDQKYTFCQNLKYTIEESGFFLLKMRLTYLLPILKHHQLLIRNQAHRVPPPSKLIQLEFPSPEAKSAILFHCPLIMKGENHIKVPRRMKRPEPAFAQEGEIGSKAS